MTNLAKSEMSSTEWSGSLGDLRPEFGFKTEGGGHTARTMMLAELTELMAAPAKAKRADFYNLIIEENALGKRTTSNRWLSARHLVAIYGLDENVTVFRLLRFFWIADPTSRPVLALLCAYARDALLRLSAKRVLPTRTGETLTSGDFVNFFNHELPGRFSEATTLSLAQNVASSWTQAGFFLGRIQKIRVQPLVTPATAAYALALGYACGLCGQVLLESQWAKLLDVPRDHIIRLAQQASKRDWLDFKGAGNVFEINFPHLLTPKEMQVSSWAKLSV